MAIEWKLLGLDDIDAACELNRIAGWNQTDRDWAGYLSYEPEGCFAVVLDGQLAGTATTIRYGSRLGWVGMVLVHPRFRRLGLGTQLLERSLAYLKAKGTRSIRLDATPMGRPVYLPLGFKDEFSVVRFEGIGTAPLASVEDVAGNVRTHHMEAGDLRQIEELDAEAFGVGRSEVLRDLARRNPKYCFVARTGAEVAGYLVARQGREAIQVGPSVARDASVAEALFAALHKAVTGERVFLDILPAQHPAMDAVARRGFKVQRSFTRMVLGDETPLGKSKWIFATSGAEKG